MCQIILVHPVYQTNLLIFCCQNDIISIRTSQFMYLKTDGLHASQNCAYLNIEIKHKCSFVAFVVHSIFLVYIYFFVIRLWSVYVVVQFSLQSS